MSDHGRGALLEGLDWRSYNNNVRYYLSVVQEDVSKRIWRTEWGSGWVVPVDNRSLDNGCYSCDKIRNFEVTVNN